MLRFASSFLDLCKVLSPNESINFGGTFLLEIVGFRFKVSKSLKFTFYVDSVKIYLNSNIFKATENVTSKRKNSTTIIDVIGFYLAKFLLSRFELNCANFSLFTTVGNVAEAESSIVEHLNLENFHFSEKSSNTGIITITLVKLEQFVVGPSSTYMEPIFETKVIKIDYGNTLDQLDIRLSDALNFNINVRLLYFISSFIKRTKVASPAEPNELFTSPWLVLINLHVPFIDVKLILPETDPSFRYFKWLQFKFTKISIKCLLSAKHIPKLTALLDKFEMVTKTENDRKIGSMHFCPIDNLLRRGPEQVAARANILMVLENILFCNWTSCENYQQTTLPAEFITDWVKSILQGTPLCSIQSEMIDLSSMDLDMSRFESLKTDFDTFTIDYFKNSNIFASRTLFAIFDQFNFNIPFEFPISSLIDHSVVLFKAGWRPLSKKTEQGFWIGDGDKFLRSDWALNVLARRARVCIEDDAFESKISVISHFQRQLAESRCRLEPILLAEASPIDYISTADTNEMQKLAKVLVVSTDDDICPAQSIALIELYKSLFAEYRGLISKRHLLTNWSLVDFSIDNLKITLSWSPKYLGEQGTLSSLLNHIENGNQISPEAIDSLSTFLGGFVDISGNAVQINLRNYSRPVLIAPDLRITGPLFLVEDGVKGPDVLVKFPVKILSENSRSCFAELPEDGTVDVLRSILPLKLYHCVFASISGPELVQASVSPYWLGCLALLDRVIDRFVKSSTEDPSPPLPGWDKLRYNIHGCHSRLSIACPCIISRITDSDPLSCTEILNLSFPHGLEIGILPGGVFALKCPESTLSVDSQHLYRIRCALESSRPLYLWDLSVTQSDIRSPSSDSSLDLSPNTLIPIIKLSKTQLELKFQIKNVLNQDPCHHWSVRPLARSNCPSKTEWEHFDTFKSFRSRSIALELSGFVGSDESEYSASSETEDIRFLYYREFERWISRFMLAHSSDIDVVKRGALHQNGAIPEIQQRASFASVFNEFHMSVDFSDLFICRLMNFSSTTESQALWSAAQRSLLNMDWRRGIVDQHGREDWVYYYGELEFINVHFCVTSHSPSTSLQQQPRSKNENGFPVNIPGIQFNDLLRAPRLFYLSLDENCFRYDPDSLNVQCQTILRRRRALLRSLAEATKELGITPPMLNGRSNQLSIAIDALRKRQKYYDSFLYKAQSSTFNHEMLIEDPGDVEEFADTSHFEIYNAQLVWDLINRDIVFKLVDEIFVLQKKKFSQSRNGLALMRKLSQIPQQSNRFLSEKNLESGSPFNYRNSSFILSPTETIDSFFESLLEQKRSTPGSPCNEYSAPFTASPHPEDDLDKDRNDIRNVYDFRPPVDFRESESISVPRAVDVSFFNPQLCFMTPSHIPAGAILVTAHEAKVEFSPIFDRSLVRRQEQEASQNNTSSLPALDAKMGTRTRISLQRTSWFSGSKINYDSWPGEFLRTCFAQKLEGLQKLSSDTEITMVYDVSNSAYAWTPSSPRIKIFGHGDCIKFNSNGLALTTTSEQFRSLLDVIVNLLVYRDPNQGARSEKLETLLIAANLTDRRTFASKMEEFRTRLHAIRTQILGRRDFELSSLEIENLLELFDGTERDLALIGEAMRMIQASREELNQKRSRLSLNILIDRIQWTLLVSNSNEPSFQLQPACNISLQNITNQWISKEDGSMQNTFEIGSAFFINQLPEPFYRNVLRPFNLHNGQDGLHLKATVDYGCLLRFFAKSRLPVNGIIVLDHVEVDLSPLQLQLTFDIATKLYKFFLPENIKKPTSVDGGSEKGGGFVPRNHQSSRPRTKTDVSELILSEQDGPFDEVLEMKERTEKNVLFVYVKVPPSQHLVSYKGSGRSSLLDIDKFILSLPEMEYNNRLWSWPEFFNQLRKDTIIVLLKNAGSLFKDKIRKLGKKNVPEGPEDNERDEQYLRNLARKNKIDVLNNNYETSDERDQKNFLVFGKSIFNLMKK